VLIRIQGEDFIKRFVELEKTFVGFVSNEAGASGKKKTCCVLRPGPTKTMTEIVSLLKYSERTDGTDAPQKKN
jgi:aspartate carbamoyltransferase catalytic subunit